MRIILRSSSNQNGTCILFQLHIFYKIYLVIDPAYTYTLTLTQTLMKGSLCIFQCILTPLMAKMHYCSASFTLKTISASAQEDNFTSEDNFHISPFEVKQ